jgi:hypothetical protein
MRLLVWCLGLQVGLLGFELSYALSPAWRWVWWVLVALWFCTGFGLALVGLFRAAMASRGRTTPAAGLPRAAAQAPENRGG